MADKKISELTSITGANVSDTNDTIAIVDSSAGQTKKITREELFKGVNGAEFTNKISLAGGSAVALAFDRGQNEVSLGIFSNSDDIQYRVNNSPIGVLPAGPATNTNHFLKQSDGDARYAQLDAENNFTDGLTFKGADSGKTEILFENATASGIQNRLVQFNDGKQAILYDLNGPNQTSFFFHDEFSANQDVVTKGRGDARYLPERGSNANGEYVRFPDGTQICWVTKSFSNITTSNGNVFTSSDIAWTFPAVFSSQPNVLADVTSSSVSWAAAFNNNNTSAVLKALNPTSFTGSREIAGTAIGRWF